MFLKFSGILFFSLLVLSYNNCSGLHVEQMASSLTSGFSKIELDQYLAVNSETKSLIEGPLRNVSSDLKMAAARAIAGTGNSEAPSIATDRNSLSEQRFAIWFLKSNSQLNKDYLPSKENILIDSLNQRDAYFFIDHSLQGHLGAWKNQLSNLGVPESKMPNSFGDRIALAFTKDSGGAPYRVKTSNACYSSSNKKADVSYENGDYLCYAFNLIVSLQKNSSELLLSSYLGRLETRALVFAPKVDRGDNFDFQKSIRLMGSKIVNRSILKAPNGDLIEGVFPSLNSNSFLLSYNSLGNGAATNNVQMLLNLGSNLSKGISKPMSPGALFGTSIDDLLCKSGDNCELNRSIYNSTAFLKNKISFVDGNSIGTNDDLKCSQLFFGVKSDSFKCIVNKKENFWAEFSSDSNFILKLAEPKLNRDENYLRPWIHPKKLRPNKRSYVYFNMTPDISSHVNTSGEYHVSNTASGIVGNSKEPCSYSVPAWNRFSQKNSNIKDYETESSFVNISKGDLVRTYSSNCKLEAIDTQNFGFGMQFQILGNPQGVYYLYQNNDLSIGIKYFENQKEIIVKFGWGSQSRVYSAALDNSSSKIYKNVWHDLDIRVFGDLMYVYFNQSLIKKVDLDPNRDSLMNGNMFLGLNYQSKNSSEIKLLVSKVELYKIDPYLNPFSCFEGSTGEEDQIKLMAIGDSITEANTSYGGSWRQDLCKQMRTTDLKIDMVGRKSGLRDANCANSSLPECKFDSKHEATSGATSGTVKQRLNSSLDPNVMGPIAYDQKVDIATIHLGTNDIRVFCTAKFDDCYGSSVENGTRTGMVNVSNRILKNINIISEELVDRNSKIKILVAQIIKANLGHKKKEGGAMFKQAEVYAFYQYHRGAIQEWADNFNLRHGRQIVYLVDMEAAMARQLRGNQNLGTDELSDLYNDTLHPKGPLSSSTGKVQNTASGTEAMAEEWLRAISLIMK